MKRMILGVMTIVLILMNGCSKGSSNEAEVLNTQAISSSLINDNWQDLCGIENLNNIYDSVGYHHNRIVSICENSASIADMSSVSVFDLTDSILNIEFPGLISSGFSSSGFANPILDSFYSEASIKNYIQSLPTSELQKASLYYLVDIMLDYDGTNLCSTIENIKAFEADLLSEHSSQDLEAVLIASSVGRYSLAYWHNRLVEDTSTPIGGFWKKFFIGTCDAVGAAGGALAGLPTVLGSIASAVTGGIATSVGAAALWGHFAN